MQTQSGTKALSDLMYDMITILHSKGEGVNAYEKYMKDAQEQNSQECMDLLQRLKKQDEAAIQEVKSHLSVLMQQESGMQGQMSSGMQSQMSSGKGSQSDRSMQQ